MFGHIGDNNLHVVAYTGRAEDKALINIDIMRMIGEYAGAITAEHGVGVNKRGLPRPVAKRGGNRPDANPQACHGPQRYSQSRASDLVKLGSYKRV